MSKFKHFITTAFITCNLLLLPHSISADCIDDSCSVEADSCEAGCGYEDCRRAPNISPSLALGFVVTIGIITLLVVNGNSHGSSSHSHS